MKVIPITAVYIVKNEEENLKRSLLSIAAWIDEIIVIDSGSEDKTVEVAHSFGAKVHRIEWQGYGESKNIGNGFASNPWILSLDADEIVDNKMMEWLKVFKPSNREVYAFRRINYIGEVLVKYALPKQWKVRLFQKDIKWDDRPVHENLLISENVHVVKIDRIIHHYSYKDLREYRRRNTYYASLSRKHEKVGSIAGRQIKAGFRGIYQFIKKYIIQFAILDGKYGYIISKESAIYTYNKYV